MKEVKVLSVRSLLIDTTEEVLRNHFAKYGKIERVKKIRDYAFIHFLEREGAEGAMDGGETQNVDGEYSQPQIRTFRLLFSLTMHGCT